MIVKSIYRDNERDYFRDKSTADKIEEQVKRHYGDIFMCDDELAEERIKKGLVKKANAKEIKEYEKQQEELNKDKEKPKDTLDDKTNELKQEIIKPLEELTIDELIDIAKNEDIELSYPKDDTAKDVIIETINKVRAERLEQSNGGEE